MYSFWGSVGEYLFRKLNRWLWQPKKSILTQRLLWWLRWFANPPAPCGCFPLLVSLFVQNAFPEVTHLLSAGQKRRCQMGCHQYRERFNLKEILGVKFLCHLPQAPKWNFAWDVMQMKHFAKSILCLQHKAHVRRHCKFFQSWAERLIEFCFYEVIRR